MTDLKKYRQVIERLLYLGFTRPDISCPTQQLKPVCAVSLGWSIGGCNACA